MLKRHLSPPPLPAPKRLRDISALTGKPSTRNSLSFDDSLYDELILCIFSHLSWVDLCTAQPTNKKWCRLAADNEIWRNLYLVTFGRPRLRGARGFLARSDGREVKPLPGRVTDPPTFRDWKWMFRISSNWRKGRCGIERLDPLIPIPATESKTPYSAHIHLAGHLTIVASSCPSSRPSIDIFGTSGMSRVLYCDPQTPTNSCYITTLAVDQAPPPQGHIRLASFLSTGEFFIFLINPFHLSDPHKNIGHIQRRGNTRNFPVSQAVYHHPLLITLTNAVSISLYDIAGDTVQHRQTLTSFTSFPPTTLVLSTPSPTTYKLVVVYAAPVYPSHWSIGATELIISAYARQNAPESSSTFSRSTFGPINVVSTRTVRAFDVPQGWIDDTKLAAVHEQWSRKISRVAGTQTDGKWVVVAPGENLQSSSVDVISAEQNQHVNSMTTLQLYRLHLPPVNSVASPLPRLTFVRNLYGQTGSIISLALADGRCVSLGSNGSLWVWDLEAGTGAEVSPTRTLGPAGENAVVKSIVAFDDRRIVTSEANKTIVRRFDI